MKDLTVRLATQQDAKAIAKLERICFATPWSEEALVQEITQNKLALYVVAEMDELLVGYAGVWGIIDEGHITNVAVHPSFRRKGIGEALMRELLQHCAKSGFCSQTLEVRPSNEVALELYKKMGFSEVGRRKGYYADNGEDALILWRGEKSIE